MQTNQHNISNHYEHNAQNCEQRKVSFKQALMHHFYFSEQNVRYSNQNNTGYIFANDQAMQHSIEQLTAKLSELVSPKSQNVAMLLGESYFLSLLPELQDYVQTVLLVDIEPQVLAHNAFMLNCMRYSDSVEEFCTQYIDPKRHPMLTYGRRRPDGFFIHPMPGASRSPQQTYIDHKYLYKRLQKSQPRLGTYFFLQNDARFQKVKQALQNVEVLPMRYNFFDDQQTQKMKAILDNYGKRLSMINVSNLYDYDMNYPDNQLVSNITNKAWYNYNRLVNNLKQLTHSLELEPVIMYSRTKDLPQDERRLVYSQITQGVEAYRQAMEAHNARLEQKAKTILAGKNENSNVSSQSSISHMSQLTHTATENANQACNEQSVSFRP